jgi:predicted nucleotidyltransferase
LVGSYARGTAREDSDIDFLIVSDRTNSLLQSDEWLRQFGEISTINLEDYGLVQSRQVFYQTGVEVEFGITTPVWLNTQPIDAGTKQVLDGSKN